MNDRKNTDSSERKSHTTQVVRQKSEEAKAKFGPAFDRVLELYDILKKKFQMQNLNFFCTKLEIQTGIPIPYETKRRNATMIGWICQHYSELKKFIAIKLCRDLRNIFAKENEKYAFQLIFHLIYNLLTFNNQEELKDYVSSIIMCSKGENIEEIKRKYDLKDDVDYSFIEQELNHVIHGEIKTNIHLNDRNQNNNSGNSIPLNKNNRTEIDLIQTVEMVSNENGNENNSKDESPDISQEINNSLNNSNPKSVDEDRTGINAQTHEPIQSDEPIQLDVPIQSDVPIQEQEQIYEPNQMQEQAQTQMQEQEHAQMQEETYAQVQTSTEIDEYEMVFNKKVIREIEEMEEYDFWFSIDEDE